MWTVTENGGDCGGDLPWAVLNDNGEQDSCHATEAEATARATELNAEAPADANAGAGGGATFAAVLALQELPTSDGRILTANMKVRTLPILLMMQTQGSHGMDMPSGTEIAGRIEEVEIIDRRIYGKGTFDTSEHGQEAERLVSEQILRWVSVDLGGGDITWMIDADGNELMQLDNYELMAATMVPIPAFEDAVIWIDGQVEPAQASKPLPDPPVLEESEGDLLDILLGSAVDVPLVPPRSWFDQPTPAELTAAGGCYVSDEGRIYGVIHVEDQCHSGSPMGQCVTVSGGTYQQFLLSSLPTTDGRVFTGPLLFAPDHAPTRRPDGTYVNAATAMAYYSNVGAAKADVACGDAIIDGQRVTWYSGALRPGVTAEDLRTLHGSVVSGDWRPIRGKQEMISLMAVNTPGFPQLLASVAASGELMAVIASAAGPAATGETCGCGGASHTPAPAVDPAVLTALAALNKRLGAIDAALAPLRRQVIEELEAGIHST